MGRRRLYRAIWLFWRILYAPIPGSWHFAFGTWRERVAVEIAGQMYYWGEAMDDCLPSEALPPW